MWLLEVRSFGLREGWQGHRFTPLASKETTREFMRALAYPEFGLNAREQEDLLSDYLPFCATVNVSNPPSATPVCRDPCDLPFLRLAIAGGADFLVARDQNLSRVSVEFSSVIVTVDGLLARPEFA